MLGRIRKNINMFTAGTVYTSFVLPILDYCGTVRRTRRSGKLRLPSKKLECMKKAFFIMVV